MKDLLERSISGICIGILIFSLSLILGFKFTFIFFTILFFSTATLILNNRNFYEKLLKLTSKSDYIEYSGKDNKSKEIKQRKDAINYYLWSGLFLLNVINACNFDLKDLNPVDFKIVRLKIIQLIGVCFIILLNSIIGMYLYRKFRNYKQYIISCSIFIILIIYIVLDMFL